MLNLSWISVVSSIDEDPNLVYMKPTPAWFQAEKAGGVTALPLPVSPLRRERTAQYTC